MVPEDTLPASGLYSFYGSGQTHKRLRKASDSILLTAILNCVYLRGENKVIQGQSTDFMGPDAYNDFTPAQLDVRVVLFRFGSRSHLVYKGQCRLEIREDIGFHQGLLVHHLPAIIQLLKKWRAFFQGKRGRATAACFTMTILQSYWKQIFIHGYVPFQGLPGLDYTKHNHS